jgi:SSS family solute:Na+ symporter
MVIGAIETHFTALDWTVVAFYMALTTWIGHALSGRNATIRDFFLGGRSLPWWAVSGSMIATEISALTFIAVPGTVFALQGDWTYLQWGIGSIIARFMVGYWLVPLYFRKEIYSPYDYMGNQLGEGVRRLVTVLFSLGAILGQSVRVLVTAMILETVTGRSTVECILLIGGFAVVWTLMGGMRTVIWTDVIQFGIFIFGGLLAFGWLVGSLGWDSIVEINRAAGPDGDIDKMRWLDFTLPWDDRTLSYTFWIGILAMPFQNMAAFGTDQLNAQRIFCCGSARDARKAMVFSSVSILITLLMLAVGSGLFAWYHTHGLSPDEAAKFAENPNFVLPVWITTVLPPGITGLVLAGAFAAAISSLDSVLAALSQTSLSAWYGRERLEREGDGPAMVRRSRFVVAGWGIFLSGFAVLLAAGYANNENKNLIDLAFGMVAYTYGPLLGILAAAVLPGRKSLPGLFTGVAISILMVAWIRPELPTASSVDFPQRPGLDHAAMPEPAAVQVFETLGLHSISTKLIESRPTLAFPWFYPINAAITLAGAMLPLGRRISVRDQ